MLFSVCALIPINFWFGCGLGLFLNRSGLLLCPCYLEEGIRRSFTRFAQGILTEAEVVELKDEKDSDGKLTTMAVYEFALPGGSKQRFKESVSSSMAGILGADTEVGVKLPLFVDRNNPDIFYKDETPPYGTIRSGYGRCRHQPIPRKVWE